MSEEQQPEEPTVPLPDQPGYWEQQAAGQPGQQPGQAPYGAPEPTVQFNPQSGYPAGQQQGYPVPPYPGQPYPGQSYPGQSYPGQPYPAQPYQGQPYPAQPYAQPYGYRPPEHPKATTALVLGLVSVVGAFAFLGLTLVISPFAWVVGSRARKEIRASNGYYGGDSNATAGMVLGIIGTILLVLGILAVFALIVTFSLLANADWDTSTVGA